MVRALPLLFVVAWAPAAAAAIRPSFSLDYCGWNATHVVVVTEGEKIDGDVEVLESWKGDLRKGDRLTLPELASFADLTKRTISRTLAQLEQKHPTHVTGSRMVLFLKRLTEGADATKGTWVPADSVWKRMTVSLVWVEKGEVYAFVQWINPGPSEIIALGMTEKEMKGRVRQLIKTQDDLARAIASKQPEALRPFVLSDFWYARKEALQALGEGGKAALPVLRKMLEDPTLLRHHSDLVQALVKAGGADVGPELTAMVGRELTFWKKTGPNLPVGRWNGAGLQWKEVERLQDRYGIALEAFRGLQEIRFAGSRQVVTEFRDFWRSLPQLEDKSGLNQMSEECDQLLEKLKK